MIYWEAHRSGSKIIQHTRRVLVGCAEEWPFHYAGLWHLLSPFLAGQLWHYFHSNQPHCLQVMPQQLLHRHSYLFTHVCLHLRKMNLQFNSSLYICS